MVTLSQKHALQQFKAGPVDLSVIQTNAQQKKDLLNMMKIRTHIPH